MSTETEQYKEYMIEAKKRNDLLWKYHQEKIDHARNIMAESEEAWEIRKEYLLSPLRRK